MLLQKLSACCKIVIGDEVHDEKLFDEIKISTIQNRYA